MKIKTASQQGMKRINYEAVFRLVKYGYVVSRANVAKLTGLSPSTVSLIVDDLVKKQILVERGDVCEGKTAIGRRPIVLEINNRNNFTIGIEVCENVISGGIFNLKNEEIASVQKGVNDIKSGLTENIIIIIKSLMKSVDTGSCNLLGIGIGLPAIVDSENKSIVFSVPLDIEKILICDQISKEFGIPVFIENECKLAGLAEKELYTGEIGSFIYLSINKGFGGCIISGNKFLKGGFGLAGEVGHMSIDINGPQCKCGNKGCLELYTTIPAVIRETVFQITSGRETVINDLIESDLNKIDEKVILEAAKMGDELAVEIISNFGKILGYGIVNIVNIFNPDVIVIGGKITGLGKTLLDNVIENVRKRALKPYLDNLTIEFSKFQKNAVALGASIYAMNHVLSEHIG